MSKVKLRWLASYFNKVYIMGQKPHTDNGLEVLHLSDNFIVVNKGCDIAINSDSETQHPVTVATQLNYKFPHLSDSSVKFGFRFCHRLDFSTSGVLCIALNKKAAKECFMAINKGNVSKYYLALVHGHVLDNSLTIDKAIGFDSRPEYSHRMCTSDKDYCQKARKAVSKLLVLQHGLYDDKPATKVLFKLVTGRRHQLRVHSKEIGHTIVGDFTYSDRKDIAPYRMFLHSYHMVVPMDLEKLDISTDDPFSEHKPINKWNPKRTVSELNLETFFML